MARRTYSRYPGRDVPPATSADLNERFAAFAWETMRLPIYGKAASRAQRHGISQRLIRAREGVRELVVSHIADQLRSPDSTTGYLSALLSDSDGKGETALTELEIILGAVLPGWQL